MGTDHGYLPAWLALNGPARRIVATDIRKGPLHRACGTAGEYGVVDRIEFILTDGLRGVDSAGLGAVVLAGMGGETIIRILDNAPWTRDGAVRLVLQPQTKTKELTAWLDGNGFSVLDASLAADGGRIYLVFSAGFQSAGGHVDTLEILMSKRDPLLKEYLDLLVRRARRALDGLERAENRRGSELAQKQTELCKLIALKEETDGWQQ